MNKKEIRIDGLTPEHVKMLDKMWSMDTPEELGEWVSTLSLHEAKMALLLRELLLMEINEHEDPIVDFYEANQVLNKFRL